MITKIKVQTVFMYACNTYQLILKVTLGKIILSHHNETSLLIFGHGDNSEFSEISAFFGRIIPNAILPFSCSSHHDSLRSPRNFESYSIVKNSRVLSYRFFAPHIKTKLRILLIMSLSISKLSLFNKL